MPWREGDRKDQEKPETDQEHNVWSGNVPPDGQKQQGSQCDCWERWNEQATAGNQRDVKVCAYDNAKQECGREPLLT